MSNIERAIEERKEIERQYQGMKLNKYDMALRYMKGYQKKFEDKILFEVDIP